MGGLSVTGFDVESKPRKPKHLLRELPKPLSQSQTDSSDFLRDCGTDESKGATNDPEMTNHCAPCLLSLLSYGNLCLLCVWGHWMGKLLAGCHLWLIFPASHVSPAGAERRLNHFPSAAAAKRNTHSLMLTRNL